MGSFGNYIENKFLDHIVGKTAYSKPTAYIALSTADPLDDASGIAEPSGNNYSRLITSGSDWNAASGGAIDNATALTFATATGSWGTITHFALYDAIAGGNMLALGSLASSQAVGNAETIKFAAGELDITLT